MKKVTVGKRVITDKNVEEYIKTLVTNFSVFIEYTELTYITIDDERMVHLFAEKPTYSDEWDISDGDCYFIDNLPVGYDFVARESIWKLEV
jgi:hypothetical protein